MSNLRTEQPVFETDRITDGFDIFFWVFNDASSFVATHWHTAIEIMYIIDGEVDVMMNQQTVILKPGDVFLIDSRLPHSTKSVHGNHAVLIQLPYEFSKKYIPDVDSFIFYLGFKYIITFITLLFHMIPILKYIFTYFTSLNRENNIQMHNTQKSITIHRSPFPRFRRSHVFRKNISVIISKKIWE